MKKANLEKEILDLLRDGKSMTVGEIVMATGLTFAVIQDKVHLMVGKGLARFSAEVLDPLLGDMVFSYRLEDQSTKHM